MEFINYSELNKTKRRVVDAFIRLHPELAYANSISRQEVEDLFSKLLVERENGGAKIGYPLWLIKGPKISRGVYVFPAPNVTNTPISIMSKRAFAKIPNDKEFLRELQEAGIEI